MTRNHPPRPCDAARRVLGPGRRAGLLSLAVAVIAAVWWLNADPLRGPKADTSAPIGMASPQGAPATVSGYSKASDKNVGETLERLETIILMTAEERRTALADPDYQARLAAVAHQLMTEAKDGAGVGRFQRLMSQWVAVDLPTTKAWIDALPPGVLRDRLVETLALQIAEKAPFEAAVLIMDKLPPGIVQDEAMLSLLHVWKVRDFAAASAWVAELPSGGLKRQALKDLTETEDFTR